MMKILNYFFFTIILITSTSYLIWGQDNLIHNAHCDHPLEVKSPPPEAEGMVYSFSCLFDEFKEYKIQAKFGI